MCLKVCKDHGCSPGETRTVLIDTHLNQELVVPEGYKSLAFSETGRYCLLVKSSPHETILTPHSDRPERGPSMQGMFLYNISTS